MKKKRTPHGCVRSFFFIFGSTGIRFSSYKEEIEYGGQQDLDDRQTDNDLRVGPAIYLPQLIVQREPCILKDRDLQEAEQEYLNEPQASVDDEDQRKDHKTQRMTGLHRKKSDEKSEGA